MNNVVSQYAYRLPLEELEIEGKLKVSLVEACNLEKTEENLLNVQTRVFGGCSTPIRRLTSSSEAFKHHVYNFNRHIFHNMCILLCPSTPIYGAKQSAVEQDKEK
ncbi:unnamed protein product [Cylicocyclus nassatus]|uniref:Uncharacterized protein n=1 Tax=Cylicocyclus nassatus TaxID=53992 RepID=A0AA36H440_CYLNA|nr:unnamed protein product [Cylicocyclus nassatus]